MLAYRSLPDEELVSLLGEGSQAAFAEIYNRYKGKLYLHAFRMLQDKEDARDLVQELFAAVWTKRDTLNVRTTLDAYLYGALRNRIMDFIAHQKVIAKYTNSLEAFVETGEPFVDQIVREKELTAIIESEIAALPPKMREVFELSRNNEFSYKQIAEKLNISDKTVKKQISNALKIIRLKINILFFVLF